MIYECHQKGQSLDEVSPPKGPSMNRKDKTTTRTEVEVIPAARRVMITKEYIHKFGATDGCAKCRAVLANDFTQPTLAHDAVCRARIEGLLASDPVLCRRLDRATQRQEEFLARRVAAGDVSAKRCVLPAVTA